MAGAGRFFQERITTTTKPTPRANAAKGTIQAVRSKPTGGGGGEDGGSVFLHERLLDQAVAVAAADGGHQFVAHAVGVGAADVVALQQNLVAAADAHHLMADFVEARGRVAGAEQGEDGEGEQAAVEAAED
jgi:hypothetical protein